MSCKWCPQRLSVSQWHEELKERMTQWKYVDFLCKEKYKFQSQYI